MIPVTFLYDEYIDRPKLSEQKKPFEYIFPPPTNGVETTIYLKYIQVPQYFFLIVELAKL